MFKYLILFVLLTPLIGIALVEDGAYATSVGEFGPSNGASIAFGAYVLGVLAVALAASRGRRVLAPLAAAGPSPGADTLFVQFSQRLLLLNVLFLLMMLFAFGGIQVWLGTLEKGLFRTSLGPFGAVPYMMTKFVIPALFAYATVLLTRTSGSARMRWLWRANALIIVVAGSTWGFKTTGVFMLLPGLLILNWRLSLFRTLLLAAAFFGLLMLFFFLFDAQLMDGVDAVQFLGERLTVLQGDVSWYVWGEYAAGRELPNYWPSLLAALGDTVIGVLVDKDSFFAWMSFHYDWMLTYIAVGSPEAIINGHSVTGTPFAEGVIAAGALGVALFAVIAGLLIGRTYRILGNAIVRGQATLAALLSTYFCFHIFAWLNGGAITQLFHISVLANVLFAYLLMQLMLYRPQSRLPAAA